MQNRADPPSENHSTRETLDNIIDALKDQRGSLIPILQSAQNTLGFLSSETLHRISARLDIPFSQVTGVVTFYSYFTTTPRGKYLLRVCLGTACYVRGGKEVLAEVKRLLGIEVGETTGDRLFSLEIGRCFGACGLAPVLMVNDNIHQRVKPTSLAAIIARYRNQEMQNVQSEGAESQKGGSI